MKRVVKSNPDGLTIEVSSNPEQQERLLAEFLACREGRCSCPTDEYEKLDSLEIAVQPEKISLRLRVRTGQVLDSHDIEKCLDHTESKLRRDR